MGKHDKESAYKAEIMPDEFYKERIKQLEGELAFANETVKKLRDENAKYGRWVNQMDTDAQSRIAKLEEENEKLRRKISKLVEIYV